MLGIFPDFLSLVSTIMPTQGFNIKSLVSASLVAYAEHSHALANGIHG